MSRGDSVYSNDLFGTRLKCLRKDRGETQKDLADFLGIKQNQIGEMENGRKASTFAKLALLCEHYNISADYLLMGRGDEGIAPYRNAGRPQRVGATLVVARPAARTSVGVDAHIRPLPWAFPLRHPGDRTERAAIKAAPTGIPGGPNA